MEDHVKELLKEAADVKTAMYNSSGLIGHIKAAAQLIIECYRKGGKVLIMGNGGSAADAQHFSAELVGRFAFDRAPLNAVALTTDTSILTAVGNDYGYDEIFTRQIRGLASKNDVIVGISTSGNSKNVLSAIKAAKEIGCAIIGFTGGEGGELSKVSNICIKIPAAKSTARIQEGHITCIHIICSLVENTLFGK